MNLPDPVLEHLSRLIVEDHSPLGLNLGKRYLIQSRIARGGMGEVFLARDLTLDRNIAIKILAKELCQDSWTQRFRDEARTMSRIDHPGVVPVHDLGSMPDGRLFYAMSYVEGETLAELMRAGRDLRRLVRILARVSTIVQQAHDRGVLHLDLKPANIMIGSNDEVYVLDWGIARVKDEIRVAGGSGIEAGTGRTSTGAVLGTLEYMSPEQARGDRSAVGGRSDVYMLGAILCEILTGEPPRRGDDAADLLERAQKEPVVLSRKPTSRAPRDLEAVVLRALSFDAEERYERPRVLADELRRWLEGDAVEARSASWTYRVSKQLARRRGIVLTSAAGLCLAAVVAALLIPRWKRETDARAEARHQLEQEREESGRNARKREKARGFIGQGSRLLEELGQTMKDLRRTPESVAEETERAALEFRQALEVQPDDPEASMGLARVYSLVRKQKEARPWVDRSIQIAPDYLPARLIRIRLEAERYEELRHRNRGVVLAETAESRTLREQMETDIAFVERVSQDAKEPGYARGLMAFAQGDYEKAQELLGEWLKANPGDAPAHFCRGHSLMHLHRDEECAAEATEALRICPRDYSPWAMRSMTRSGLGDHAGALADAEVMLRLWPKPDSYVVRGKAQWGANNLKAALADMSRALELDPKDALTWSERARVRRDLGDREGAVRDAEEALRVDPDHEVSLITRATLRMAANDWDGMMADCERAKKLDPGDPEPYKVLGSAFTHRKDEGQAMAQLNRAIELAPRDPGAWELRGRCRAELLQYDRAIEDLTEAARLNPKDDRLLASRAYARRKNGNLDEALVDVDLAIKLNPTVSNTWAIRADIHRDMGNDEASVADFTKCLEINPSQPLILLSRAKLLEKTDREAAIRDYTRALEIDPRHLNSLFHRGVLLKAKRDFDGAARDFQAALSYAPVNWGHRRDALQFLDAVKEAGGRAGGLASREARAAPPAPDRIQELVRDLPAGPTEGAAGRLLQAALREESGSAPQYVLLNASAREAAAAGDGPAFYAALGPLEHRFAIDLLSVEEALLARAAQGSTSAAGRLAELETDLVFEALASDRFDLLERATSTVATLSKDGKGEGMLWIRDVVGEQSALREQYERALEAVRVPGSGDASAAGRHLAFTKGNWDQGLPLLEKYSQAPLKWAAERDLRSAKAGTESLEIGDAWRDLAGQEKSRVGVSWLSARARRWYEWTLHAGAADAAQTAGERIKSLPPAPPPLDLLRRIVPADHVLTGSWVREEALLVNHAGDSFDKLEIPYEPAEEYDLLIEVQRLRGPHTFVVGLATPKAQVTVTMDGWDGSTSGIDLLDRRGGGDNETTVRGRIWLQEGKQTLLFCQVRRGSLRVHVNGERLIDWSGNFDRFSMHPNVAIRNTRGLFLGSWRGGPDRQSDFALSRIELTPLSGPGRFVR